MSRHRFSRARRAGFTIVELTIVLVVIGLLLSGILKGQELINGAKIRAIVDRQNSIRIAWFEFVDHFGAKPGDFARAEEFIANATNPTLPADGGNGGNGLVEIEESTLAVEHLTLAGLLRCQQCVDGDRDVGEDNPPDAENSPTNQYDGVISIWHEDIHYAIHRISSDPPAPRRLQIHTGPRIPSNILAEVDRKIDDGLANSGGMVFNQYDPTDPTLPTDSASGTNRGRPNPKFCMNIAGSNADDGALDSDDDDIMQYRIATRAPSVEGNCGAGIFI